MSLALVPAASPVCASDAARPRRPMSTLPPAQCPVSFAGVPLVADGAPALWWAEQRTLIVADIHLDKGASLNRQGLMVPSYDTAETLGRLEALVRQYQPQRVVCLGDSVHRRDSWARLPAPVVSHVRRCLAKVEDWVWITGNHDPEGDGRIPGRFLPRLDLGPLSLTHEPPLSHTPGRPTLCGHLHPKVRVQVGGRRISGRCFVIWHDLLIVPAFGAFTGGLSVTDPAIASLREAAPRLVLSHRDRVVRVPAAAEVCR